MILPKKSHSQWVKLPENLTKYISFNVKSKIAIFWFMYFNIHQVCFRLNPFNVMFKINAILKLYTQQQLKTALHRYMDTLMA